MIIDPQVAAGLSLVPPRPSYEVATAWGTATLTRRHLLRTLDTATLAAHQAEGGSVATFEMTPFVAKAVETYRPPPAQALRALIVELGLLSRPELVWTGALPEGWQEGFAAPLVEAIPAALRELHERFVGLTDEKKPHYALRELSCAECLAARLAASPPGTTPWQVRYQRHVCGHGPSAFRALAALCTEHPELTFEVLGWFEPAGAVITGYRETPIADDAPAPSRFVLGARLIETLIGPWLVGEEPVLGRKSSYHGHSGSWRWAWENRHTPRKELPRWEQNGVAFAATAWEVQGVPEELVEGDASAPEPSLDRAAAPHLTGTAALPGSKPRRRKPRAAAK
jgi:hypothetical protein